MNHLNHLQSQVCIRTAIVLVLILTLGACSAPSKLAGSSAVKTSDKTDSAGCLNALIDAQTYLKEGRAIEVRTSFANIQGYPDAPSNRPHRVILAMAGEDSDKVMESEPLRSSISTNLLRNCSSTGMVTIAVANSGYFRDHGVMKDGTITTFQCVENRLEEKEELRWGQQFCNL